MEWGRAMAIGITWSAIYLGTVADLDTNEASYTIETAAPLLTTFGRDGDPLASHITTLTTNSADNGDLNTNNTGSADTLSYNLGAGKVTAKLDSMPLMTGTVTFYDGSSLRLTDLSVMQDSTGALFLLIRDNQPALAAAGIKSVTFTAVTGSNYVGLIQTNRDDLKFVCFAAGTPIDTPTGPRPVEALTPGALVLTLDHGPQPVLWAGARHLIFDRRDHPGQPVELRAGAFGPGRPSRDLVVSPDHRLLLEAPDGGQALAAAKALEGLAGVRRMRGKRAVCYHAILLPMHAVIFAAGVAAESLYPGPQAFGRLDGAERAAWLRLLGREGRLAQLIGAPPARPLLGVRAARAALARGALAPPGLGGLIIQPG